MSKNVDRLYGRQLLAAKYREHMKRQEPASTNWTEIAFGVAAVVAFMLLFYMTK